MLSIRDEQQTRDDDAARHLLITPCGDRIVLMGEAGDFLLGPEGGAMLHRQAEREEDARAAAAELEHEAAAAASLQEYLAGEYEVISVRQAGTPRSDCCSCRPAFELTPGDPTGLCAKCGEYASFSALD